MTTPSESSIALIFVSVNTAIAAASILVSLLHIYSAAGSSARRYAIGAAACMLALLVLDLTGVAYLTGAVPMKYLVQDGIRNISASISMTISVGCSVIRFRVFATSAAPWYTRTLSNGLLILVMLLGGLGCAFALIEHLLTDPAVGKTFSLLSSGAVVIGGSVDFILTLATFRVLRVMGSSHRASVSPPLRPGKDNAWTLKKWGWRSPASSREPSTISPASQIGSSLDHPAAAAATVGLETFHPTSTMGEAPPPFPISPSSLHAPNGQHSKPKIPTSISSNRLLAALAATPGSNKNNNTLIPSRSPSSNTLSARRKQSDIQALASWCLRRSPT
ncbi:hypothetical protein BC828DRAFT_403475 [Blastocladiella britannica]|nr:hypothetical protein BC828DRAFT_403475 [Blastocladiella britannica]